MKRLIYTNPMRTALLTLVGTLGLVACSESPRAAPVYTSLMDRQAVGGYDLVSFFSGKPLMGNEKYETQYLGASWRFSSRANMELFQTNPEAFLPQYGGHCSWAMAHGKPAKGSPENWHVRDGRLYFNYNARVHNLWSRNITVFIGKADQYWPTFSTE